MLPNNTWSLLDAQLDEAAWKTLHSLKMSFFLMGHSLMHICAWFHLWLMIQRVSGLKAILEILKFNPLGLQMSFWSTDGEFQSHAERRFDLGRTVAQMGLPSPHRCYLSPLYTNRPLVEEKIAIVKQVFRFFFPPSSSPSSHINMCLSLGSRQVSLKLSSDQTKKTDFWQNKKCPCGPRRPQKAKFRHK